MHAMVYVWEAEDNLKRAISLSTEFDQGIKLRSSGLVSSVLTLWTISSSLLKLFKKRLTWSLLQPCYIFGKRDWDYIFVFLNKDLIVKKEFILGQILEN